MKNRADNQNWERASLFEVSNRDVLLEFLKRREHESRQKVIQETARRRQLEIERQLEEFDKEINLKRILRNDRRYLSIGRDRPKPPTFFDKVTMARIARQVSKIRCQRKGEISIDPREFETNEKRCERLLGDEYWRKRVDGAKKIQTVKLPKLIAFKKSDNSDIVSHRLELEQLVKSQPKRHGSEYSVIQTSISIVRPKY